MLEEENKKRDQDLKNILSLLQYNIGTLHEYSTHLDIFIDDNGVDTIQYEKIIILMNSINDNVIDALSNLMKISLTGWGKEYTEWGK